MDELHLLPGEPLLRDAVARAQRYPLSTPLSTRSDAHSGFIFGQAGGERTMRLQRKQSAVTVIALVLVETRDHLYICGEDSAKPDQTPILLTLRAGELTLEDGEQALRLVTGLKTYTLPGSVPAPAGRRRGAEKAAKAPSDAPEGQDSPETPTEKRRRKKAQVPEAQQADEPQDADVGHDLQDNAPEAHDDLQAHEQPLDEQPDVQTPLPALPETELTGNDSPMKQPSITHHPEPIPSELLDQ